MKLELWVGGFNYSPMAQVDSLTIEQDSTEAISTMVVEVFAAHSGAEYDSARYDEDVYAFEFIEYSVVEVRDADRGGFLEFAGMIASVQKKPRDQHMVWVLSCIDWGTAFERTTITQSWPAGTTDAQIFKDVVAKLPASWGIVPDPVGVFVIANDLGLLEAKDQSARDLVEAVCDLTNGEWHVTYDKKARYYKSGNFAPPFSLTDEPNGTTSVGFAVQNYRSDFSRGVNRVTVLGQIDSDGNEIRGFSEDASVQPKYGILSRTIVDRQISDPIQANLRAASEVYSWSTPQIGLTAEVYQPGLARGQTVPVRSIQYGLDQSLIVRSVKLTIIAPDRELRNLDGRTHHVAKWTATFGTRVPDVVWALRRLQRRPTYQTAIPPTPIPPGSIDAGDFAAGIEPIQVVNALPPLPDPQYSATAVVFLTTDRKLYRRTGDTWTAYVDAGEIQGQIQSPQLAPGSVISTVLADGAVVSAKIPTGAIISDKIAAGAVEANAIAANAIGAEKIQANAITAGKIAANAVVAGNIAALAVQAGNIAADAVTAGTIAAAAVIASKIAAGAVTTEKLDANEIQLGYGSSRPSVFTAWNPSSQIVAALGDLSRVPGSTLPANTYFGIWAKIAGFGGSKYEDAPIYTDASGNLFVRNSTLTITGSDGTTIKTSPSTFDPTYNALALEFAKSGDSTTRVVSRGLIVYDSGGRKVGSLVRSPSGQGGELNLIGPSGQSGAYILLDGMTGRVRGDGGFQCQGYVGMNTAIQVRIGDGSTRTMTFVGGLLTSIASP